MGLLKSKEEFLENKTRIIKTVLNYFDRQEKKYSRYDLEQISSAADLAFSDEILYEEFENWVANRDDESFVFLIHHYWETKSEPALGIRADISGMNKEINEVKENAKRSVARNFSSILQSLCNEKKLKTYKEIGRFLGGLTEERVRILLEGKHKPQRRTILKVAEKFRIDASDLMIKIVG